MELCEYDEIVYNVCEVSESMMSLVIRIYFM